MEASGWRIARNMLLAVLVWGVAGLAVYWSGSQTAGLVFMIVFGIAAMIGAAFGAWKN